MLNPEPPQEAAELLRGATELLGRASELQASAGQVQGRAGQLRGRAGAAVTEALDQLVRLAAHQVPGCSGASATLWQDGEPAVFTASHPDLAELAGIECSAARGPGAAALAGGGPVCTPDMLDERRWPEYAAGALSRGVRSSVTVVHRSGLAAVTLSLFGARPGRRSTQPPETISS